MNLSAPWYTYAKKVKAFFAYDDEVSVGDLEKLDDPSTTGGSYLLTITVKDPTKAYALEKLVRPDTFKGHLAVADVAKKLVPGGKVVYLRFLPEIIQFFDDDISDYSGNYTELINKAAEDIIDFDNYCARPCIVDLKENE